MALHYHLIGIGGIGMSAIARLLLRKSLKVTGSDLKVNKSIEELRALGAEVFIGHDATNVKGADIIVYSSAVKEDNPEIKEAEKLSIPLIKRAQALAKLMRDKSVITVAGSHGKTTTSSLVAFLLLKAGYSPTIAVGGIMRDIDTNAYGGSGDYFVAEADESDGSFLYYFPDYSIITNIDREHMDYYKEFDKVVEAFTEFMNKTKKRGCLFCCNEDSRLKDIIKDYKNRYVLFGLNPDADVYPRNIVLNGFVSEFDCFYRDKLVDRFYLPLAGEHNISNALAVIAVGLEMGIKTAVIKDALAEFKGTKRRLELKFKNDSYMVIDDYAHHPTEIKKSLCALKSLGNKRIIAVFQPHRFSRTKLLLEEFGRVFDAADHVIVTDIYSAGEQPLEWITAKSVCNKILEHAPDKLVEFIKKEEIVSHILKKLKKNDLIVILGAGDITKISDELSSELSKMPEN